MAMLSWIWAICLFPCLGSVAYWLFGIDRFERQRLRRRRRRRNAHLALEGADGALLRLLEGVNALPTSSVEEMELLIDASSFYPALLQQIREARHHIHVIFFLWRDDSWGRTFRDELAAAARRGVTVRLLLDEIGCVWLRAAFFEPLIAAGGEFSWCNTLHPRGKRFFFNLRNHRKIQVFDGHTAFIGGMNIGREYAGADPSKGRWRDLQLQVRGAVVEQLQHVFAEDWYFATGKKIAGRSYSTKTSKRVVKPVQLIVGGPDSRSKEVEKSLVALLNFAKERVWILPSYFVPNRVILNALQLCAVRGVDVRILVSKRSDHPYLCRISRAYYGELLGYGVRIFEFAAALSHSKVMLIDRDWLMVGSANLDRRSLELNFEANLLLRAPEELVLVEQVLAEDFANSSEIFRCGTSFSERLMDGVCRLMAPLL